MRFFVKNCLSRRPFSDKGVPTELSWRSIAFLRCSWWRLSALSRCFHCASTAHAPRFHGVATALRTQWHLQERRAVSVQTPRTTTAFAQRPLCARAELLSRCRRPYCAAMVTLRRPRCALLGRRVTVFVLSMLKVRTVARRSMRPHRVQWRCHCVTAVMLAFVLRAPRRSAIFKDTVGSP